MANFESFTLSSPAVGRRLTLWLYRPPVAGDLPILYLLHGRTGAPDDWLRVPALRAWRESPLAIACLAGNDSFYTNRHDGQGDWEDSLIYEQIPAIERRFAVGGTARRRVLAGLSMGGFGAIKMALKYPHEFGTAYSTSGALGATHDHVAALKQQIFGPMGAAPRRENDPFLLARALPGPLRPTLALDCGLEDELIDPNRRFSRLLTELDWPHRYREYPGGHDWDYWDARMDELLAFALRTI